MEIGKDKLERPLYWNLERAANAHLFCLGSTGFGKTYKIGKLLKDCIDGKYAAIILDSTNKMKETLLKVGISEEDMEEYFVREKGLPVNPFKKQRIQIGNRIVEEKDSDVAERVLGNLNAVIGKAPRQRARIRKILIKVIERKNVSATFLDVRQENLNCDDNVAFALDDKLSALRNLEISEQAIMWNKTLEAKKIFIVNLSGYAKEIMQFVSEMILQDIWYFAKNRVESNEFIVCLDEIQNFDFSKDNIICDFLAEGRKYGIAIWSASQNFKSNFPPKIKELLMQSGVKLFFKPSDEEARDIAKLIDRRDAAFWEKTLKQLDCGDFVCIGDMHSENCRVAVPIIIKATKQAKESH